MGPLRVDQIRNMYYGDRQLEKEHNVTRIKYEFKAQRSDVVGIYWLISPYLVDLHHQNSVNFLQVFPEFYSMLPEFLP